MFTDAQIQTYIAQEEIGNVKRGRKRVLRYVIENPDCTTLSIEHDLYMQRHVVSARLSELTKEGKIYPTGEFSPNEKGNIKYSKYRYEPSKNAQARRAHNQRKEIVGSIVKRIRNEYPDFIPTIILQLTSD